MHLVESHGRVRDEAESADFLRNFLRLPLYRDGSVREQGHRLVFLVDQPPFEVKENTRTSKGGKNEGEKSKGKERPLGEEGEERELEKKERKDRAHERGEGEGKDQRSAEEKALDAMFTDETPPS